jgi:hypothetical protein
MTKAKNLGIEHLKEGENAFTWRTVKTSVKTLTAKQVKSYALRKNPYSTVAYSLAGDPKNRGEK